MTEITRRLQALGTRRVGAGAISAAALTYVLLVDPHRTSHMLPRCPFKLATGLDCPGCGGLRMAYDIVHGDARAALHDNPFLLACSPVLATLLFRGMGAAPERDVVPVPVAYGLALSAFVWMAVRNVPGWPLRPTIRG